MTQLTNDSYRDTIARIQKMNVEEVRRFIVQLEESQANSFPDDDLAGDIAESTWLALARDRLRDLIP